MSEPSVILLYEKRPSLEEAQKKVGGLVELISLSDGDQLLVNEEGLFHDLPYNEFASYLAGRRIVGDAVILRGQAKWID
tara:strand:+ start:1228 stop:1464 length:237 start_codon:yes stop_codon:yes gene_type:complete